MTTKVARGAMRVVAIGGGTGLHALLLGLHRRGDDLTAIITVADDGGSSGRLRKDFEIPPPGDIRNCLVALSDADPILGDLFQYRFENSMLEGHAFGNLFIAVLARLSGDFRGAIERARVLLGVRGRVLPSTDKMVVLVAEHPDGSRSTGEQAISRSGKPIQRIRLAPTPPPVSEEIRDALHRADLIVLGPGSLYTSIAPNLLVPGLLAAIAASPARCVLVGNLMTQPGETDGFDLDRHVEVVRDLGVDLRLDLVIAPSDPVDPQRQKLYAASGAEPVMARGAEERAGGVEVFRAPMIAPGPQVRHDSERLAEAVHAGYELLVGRSGTAA